MIVEGVESEEVPRLLFTRCARAGRPFGRKEAKRRFTRAEMDARAAIGGVTLIGGSRRKLGWPTAGCPRCLPSMPDWGQGAVHRLRLFAVAMAGENEFDLFKD